MILVNIKKIMGITALAGVLSLSAVVYASTTEGPKDVLAKVTNKSAEDVQKERQNGLGYGKIAEKEGKGEEFKKEMIENKKAIIKNRVEEGVIDQKTADEIIKELENCLDCDGTCEEREEGLGKKYGLGFGRGSDNKGHDENRGNGSGKGMGKGMGKRQ